jgi:hypothetical protein
MDLYGAQLGKKIKVCTHSILLLIVSSNIKYFAWVSNTYCNNYCMQYCKSEIMTCFDRGKVMYQR